MYCPSCKEATHLRTILRKLSNVDYGHSYCDKCGISFDSNVNYILENYSKLNENEILSFQEDEYRKYFIATPDITDGSDDIYTMFNWDNQEKLKTGIIQYIQATIAKKYSGHDEFSVLDIGCADGFSTVLLSELYPNARFVAIDPSPQINKLKNRERIRVYQSILQKMNFADKSFDIVMILGNLMLHADPLDTLKIAKQLLTDDGVLFFDFKNINSSSRIIARKLAGLNIQPLNRKEFIQRNFVAMRYGYSRNYMTAFCESVGLKVIESYSKPPRLLEFGNKSKYTRGLSGIIWRLLNILDKSRDEMAWLQFTCVKKIN